MSVTNPWGAPPAAAPVKLNDLMDEELAAKLQREEEEQLERDIAAQFGDRDNVGWCFVEVPSSDCEYGVMSVVQQEVPMGEQNGDPNDPDYAFALELQAQEAEEYDRLRRQEASSIERIQVMRQDPQPKDHSFNRPFRPNQGLPTGRSRRSLQRYQSASSTGEFAVHIEEEYEYDSDDDSNGHIHHIHSGRRGSETAFQHEDPDPDDEDLFLEDDLPIANFNALDISLRGPGDRKRRPIPSSSSSRSAASASSSRSGTSPTTSHHHHHHHHHHGHHGKA